MNVSIMSTAPTDANEGADALAAASATAPRSAWSHANVAEIVPSLPLETRWPAPSPLRLYGGFWLPEVVLRMGIAAVHTCFEPRSTDIFLATSYPKSGTTWLKALAFATLNRDTHSPFDADHPLRHRNPHDCVRFVEGFALANDIGAVRDELEALPSPRALATHLPYSLLPERITEEGLGCRILYICRNPKDALVSAWFFFRKTSSAMGVDARSFTLQEAFELFCEGISAGGPQWLHVLQYWEQSQRRPDKVLFLRYEEMLREPVRNLKKMAKFMGCGFSKEEEEEEEGGVVHGIVELCSMDELKNMEVNRNGYTQAGTKSDSFFRKGTIGDWNDHMSPEMAERLDKIVGVWIFLRRLLVSQPLITGIYCKRQSEARLGNMHACIT